MGRLEPGRTGERPRVGSNASRRPGALPRSVPAAEAGSPGGFGERLYRIALFAYPGAFRRRYAADMIRYFRARRAALRRRSTLAGSFRLGVEMAWDLLRSVPRQHLVSRRRSGSAGMPGGPSSVGPMGTVAAGIRGALLMETTLADIRCGFRSLVREPGFAATVVLTLALGIGASAAVFSIVDGVLLEPLPYYEPDRLAYVFLRNDRFPRMGMSVVDYLAVIEQQEGSFDSVAAFVHSRQANAGGPPLPSRVAVTGGSRPESVSAAWIAGRLFTTLGVEIDRGRDFREGEDQPEAEPVVIISSSFSERFFGAGESAVGRQVQIEGRSFTVVGVLPPGIDEVVGVRAEVWPQFHLYPPARRGPFYLRVIGRLTPDVSFDRAADELGRISDTIFPLWVEGFQDRSARMDAAPLREVIIGDLGPVLLLISGAVALVMAITVANVASLTLTRAVGRRREIGVRAALGAGYGRLARFLMTENLALAAIGGLLGSGLAAAFVAAFRRLGPSLPRLDEVGIDAGVVGFAAAVTLVSGLLIGASPLALLLSGGRRTLRPERRGSSSGRNAQRLRGALVFGEFALTVPLLVAAGLLLTSLWNLQSTNPGFDPDGTLTVPIGLPEARYPDRASTQRFWQEVEREAAQTPGVVAAGLATGLPPDLPAHFNNFDLVDRPVEAGAAQPQAPWSDVTPGFFDALAIPLREGRTFRATDDDDNALVAVVTRAWAERYYPAESAVGKQMIAGGCIPCGPTTIVGVVGDVKYRGLGGDGEGVYAAASQEAPRNMYLVVRSDGPVEGIVPLLRVMLRELDPELPFEPVTMNERLFASVASPRHWTTLLAAFGVAAVALVAVGTFGLLTYFVDRQRREIGVRMALGAAGANIVGMVVRRGFVLAVTGVAAGLAASLWLTRWLETLLYEVSPTDRTTWAGVAALLLLVALGSCYLPARRAARVEPLRALSAE